MKNSTLRLVLLAGMLTGLPMTDASAAVGGRIGACKQELKAKGLKGDERKTFMKSCRDDALKACKEELKSAGADKADRHAFIKSCLKGDDASGATTAPTAPAANAPAPIAPAPTAPGSNVPPGTGTGTGTGSGMIPEATPPAPKP
ncbi:PsiF family protein [Methylobacterium sp. CM6241]